MWETSHFATAIVSAIAGVVIGVAIGLRMAMSDVRLPVILPSALWCAAGTGVMLVAAMGTTIYSTYFVFASEPAPATVIWIRKWEHSEGLSFQAVYKYTDSRGIEYRDTFPFSGGRYFAIGDIVQVRYLREKPAESRLASFSHHCFLPFSFGAISILLGAISAALYCSHRAALRRH